MGKLVKLIVQVICRQILYKGMFCSHRFGCEKMEISSTIIPGISKSDLEIFSVYWVSKVHKPIIKRQLIDQSIEKNDYKSKKLLEDTLDGNEEAVANGIELVHDSTKIKNCILTDGSNKKDSCSKTGNYLF